MVGLEFRVRFRRIRNQKGRTALGAKGRILVTERVQVLAGRP